MINVMLLHHYFILTVSLLFQITSKHVSSGGLSSLVLMDFSKQNSNYRFVAGFHFVLPAVNNCWTKVKVGVLCPVQQPGLYWDRSSELPLVGLEPTEVTAYD